MLIYPTTREIAKQQKSKYYQTGVPCKHGHDSPRLTSNGACVGCRPLRRKQYYETHKQAIIANNKQYAESWRTRNPDLCKAGAKRWRDNNKDVLSFHRTKRRKQTSIVLLTEEEKLRIKQIYANRPEGYHVDHIIPLAKGGKHHPDNLQYLPAIENLKKGSRYTSSS